MLSAFARPAMARASVNVPVSTRQMSTNGQGGFSGFLNGDSGNLSTSFFHKLNTVIMVSTPLACGSLFTDSITFRPFEVVLGLALPLHGHIGMNYVITDYVKKFLQSYIKDNLLIIELKSDALNERHWKQLTKQLRVNWVLSE